MPRSARGKKDPWRKNRRFFSHIKDYMWEWFEHWLGGDGITLRVIIMAGGRHARKIAQALLNIQALIEAGFPVNIDLVAVTSEDPRTKEGCAYWNAHKRFYGQCAKKRNNAETGPQTLFGDWIEEYVTSIIRWIEEEKQDRFFFSYGDPSDDEFRKTVKFEERIRDLRGLDADARPFHAAFCLPWGRWIGTYVREMCGELVQRTPGPESKPILKDDRRQLQQVGDSGQSHGLIWGLHPVDGSASRIAADALQGSDPLRRLLAQHIDLHNEDLKVDRIEARLALYGIGPRKMDDGRTLNHFGPPGPLCNWMFADRKREFTLETLKDKEVRQAIRLMVEGTKELIVPTFHQRSSPNSASAAANAIANQIWVLYHAHNGIQPS